MKNSISSFLLAALVLVNFSCKKNNNDDETEINVAQDKQNIDNGINEIIACVGDFEEGKSVTSTKDFFGLSFGEVDANKEEWAANMIQAIMNGLEVGVMNSQGDYEIDSNNDLKLDISDIGGIYTYNSSMDEFEYNDNGSNEVTIKMPSTSNKTSNNCTVVLEEYTYETHSIEGENTPLPKTAKMSVTIDNELTFGIDLTEITYSNYVDIVYPSSVNITITAAPYVITLSGSENNGTFEVDYSMTSDVLCNFSTSGTLVFAHNDFDNITVSDIQSADATITYGSLGLSGNANLTEILKVEELTPEIINQYADLNVLVNGTRVGELVIDEDTEGNVMVNIVYLDGTSDDVYETYIKPNESSLEAEVSSTTGSWE